MQLVTHPQIKFKTERSGENARVMRLGGHTVVKLPDPYSVDIVDGLTLWPLTYKWIRWLWEGISNYKYIPEEMNKRWIPVKISLALNTVHTLTHTQIWIGFVFLAKCVATNLCRNPVNQMSSQWYLKVKNVLTPSLKATPNKNRRTGAKCWSVSMINPT